MDHVCTEFCKVRNDRCRWSQTAQARKKEMKITVENIKYLINKHARADDYEWLEDFLKSVRDIKVLLDANCEEWADSHWGAELYQMLLETYEIVYRETPKWKQKLLDQDADSSRPNITFDYKLLELDDPDDPIHAGLPGVILNR